MPTREPKASAAGKHGSANNRPQNPRPGLPARSKKYPTGTPTLFAIEITRDKPATRPVAISDRLYPK